MWPFKKKNIQKDKISPKFRFYSKDNLTPPSLIFNESDSIEEKTRKIVHANISDDDKWHLFNILSSTMNIRYDSDAYHLYIEMAKQCKRNGHYSASILYNCLPIIEYFVTFNEISGLTHEIAIAIRKSGNKIKKEDFAEIFTQAYNSLFADLNLNVSELIEIVWKHIETDGNIFNYLPSESIPDFKSSGHANQDEHLGNTYEKVKDYNNAIKAYQSAFELQKGATVIPPRIFMRQAIAYRKLKQYDNEIDIIKTGLIYGNKQSIKEMEKLKSRLSRAEQLLLKSKS
ncbi:tetratricopeptide repeat protein [Pediococcus pentosaceus]|uniref:tetratricopeptide repeat protein n=1 Tax=Pediococcus pentosaceus TaxID=1255 RepID=UPI00223BCB57|nr:hypothetical protein [Pediococcus pentosaceus]MCS8572509.1 hypothetical protein [Pediococcus pentosaceus]